MLLVAPVRTGDPPARSPTDEERREGLDRLKVVRSSVPGDHPRGLLRPVQTVTGRTTRCTTG